VNKKRPVNLDLMSMKFPPMAIISILHRISGILLFLLTPFMLYLLDKSLQSNHMFEQTKVLISNLWVKLVLWAFLSALFYHLLAGIRHLLMDFGLGEELQSGYNSSIGVIVIAVLATIMIGIWIW
jgi:succinate dehydrogenase cytochrome b subunit